MDKAALVLVLIMLNVSTIRAEFTSSCEVEGADRYDWLGYFTVDTTINDDHEGLVATFKTKHVLALTGQSSRYLNASFKDEVLTVVTNENFKHFEEEYDYNGYMSNTIQLILDFDCDDGGSESLDMRQKVVDVNNHYPALAQEVYEFNFGMRIPQDYDLTKFLKISASDVDFSNRNMYFSIGFSEHFRITYKTDRDYYENTKYLTTLKTLKEIRGPFTQKLTLIATDGGTPARTAAGTLIVRVTSEGSENGGNGTIHPPVFEKHLYFADYTTNGNLEMEEPIRIKYGVQSSTIVRQTDYQEYFQIKLESAATGILQVTKVKSLPNSVLKKTKLIVIEIEAENQGLHIPGRTALIIRLHTLENSIGNSFQNSSKSCNTFYVSDSWTDSDGSSEQFVLYSCIIAIMAMVNIGVLIWFLRRGSLNRVTNQHISITQVPELKKVPLF